EEQETPPEKPSEKPQPEEQAEDTPAPKETEEEEDQPSESEPKPDQPQPSNPTPPKPPEEGDPADKESDATSIIEAPPEKWKTGKPLASPGLEIQTKRPEFTLLQLLTTAPRNPLCMINFGANGKPTEALIVESSGSSAMDSAIISSLYRWRARGKRLRELSKGQTAMVRIRIILRN
ncbi:MAG: hypothetical protein O7G85_08060, partial [Planctomycetota bacterium]|nr:hypothetical protein [Planctomycetota bacterium]